MILALKMHAYMSVRVTWILTSVTKYMTSEGFLLQIFFCMGSSTSFFFFSFFFLAASPKPFSQDYYTAQPHYSLSLNLYHHLKQPSFFPSISTHQHSSSLHTSCYNNSVTFNKNINILKIV